MAGVVGKLEAVHVAPPLAVTASSAWPVLVEPAARQLVGELHVSCWIVPVPAGSEPPVVHDPPAFSVAAE